MQYARADQASPQAGEPEQYRFDDDGTFPNNAALPVLIYRAALGGDVTALARALEAAFARNAWPPAWRSGLFDFHHYHSTAHEVLGVYRGQGRLRLGGPTVGERVTVTPGDVIVLPAGVAHRDEGSSADLGLVGAYPQGQQWDMMLGEPGERPTADSNIAATPLPPYDPLHGSDGPLTRLWHG